MKNSLMFESTEEKIDINFSESYMLPEHEKYEGTYIVIPQSKEQVLPTSNKYLIDDVTIKEIPYYEVSNDAGGKTITIGPMK